MISYKKLDQDIRDFSARRDNPLGLDAKTLGTPTREKILEDIDKLIPQGVLPISKCGYRKERISSLEFILEDSKGNECYFLIRDKTVSLTNFFMIAGTLYDAPDYKIPVDLSRVINSNQSLFDINIIIYAKTINGAIYLYAVRETNAEGISLFNIPVYHGKVTRTDNTYIDGKTYRLMPSTMNFGVTWVAGYYPQEEVKENIRGGGFLLRKKHPNL